MAAASLSITVTDDVGGCVSDCLSVDKVSMNYKKKPGLIQSLVRIVDETGSGVRDALVHVEWILPDGKSVHQYSRTGKRSSAEFTLSADTAGHHTLNVVQVTKVGYSFDPDSSNVLSGSIDISP
jgi:hypothetical protein